MNKSVHTAIDAERRWDVAVVGGGPAGMMAALTAASKGKKVVLIEKNDSLGRRTLQCHQCGI
jgi:NADPH-dependent 2,4-dienoyl-CoA reductase/sulfur reductase-like enzyme